MRTRRSLVALLVLPLCVGSTTSCTLIGMAVGASADRHNEKVVGVVGSVQDLHALKEGTRVELLLRDGRKLRGRYLGAESTEGRELRGTAEVSTVASLRLQQSGATLLVPSEDVIAVGRLATPGKHKAIGLAIGALVDAAVIKSWNDHWRNYDK
jgi:hypothetical protein